MTNRRRPKRGETNEKTKTIRNGIIIIMLIVAALFTGFFLGKNSQFSIGISAGINRNVSRASAELEQRQLALAAEITEHELRIAKLADEAERGERVARAHANWARDAEDRARRARKAIEYLDTEFATRSGQLDAIIQEIENREREGRGLSAGSDKTSHEILIHLENSDGN